MDDGMTEPFKPYRPQPDPPGEPEAYDYEEHDDRPRILWGRIVALAIGLVLAFFLGRASAPDGVPEEDLKAARGEVSDLEDENEQLRTQLAQARQEAEEEPEASPSPTVSASPTTDAEGEIVYVVQPGETLNEIAERLCGDAAAAQTIMDLNGISDPTALSSGAELTLPSGCDTGNEN